MMKVFQSGEFVTIHMPLKVFELRMPLEEVAGPEGITIWASESSFKWLWHPVKVRRVPPYIILKVWNVDYYFNTDEVDLEGLTFDGWGMAGAFSVWKGVKRWFLGLILGRSEPK